MAVGQVNGTFWYNSSPLNGGLAKLWQKAGFYTSVDSGDTVQDNPLTATATVVNVTNGALFAVGNVIQMQLEYAYVISIAGNALTIQRGYDNTTPASHIQTTIIYKLTLVPPAQDAAEPAAGYQQGADVTTAVAYGGTGAYRWTDVPDGEYYVSVYYDGHRGWLSVEVESRFTPNAVLKIQGDILFRGATDLQRLPKGTLDYILVQGANEPYWGTLPGGLSFANFQRFTSSGTWTKPAGVTFVLVEVIGGGGGGGGGAGKVGAYTRSGGGGGGAGAIVQKTIVAALCGATEAVTVGAGGTSGAGGSAAAGSPGGTGGTSSFGSILWAYGGGGGSGAPDSTSTSAGGGGGGTAGAGGSGSGSTPGGAGLPKYTETLTTADALAGGGAAGSTSTAAGYSAEYGGGGGGGDIASAIGRNGGSSMRGGGAGGGGGGGGTGTQFDGGDGGKSGSYYAGGGGAGGAAGGANGTAGADGNDEFCGSGGGGGGGIDNATPGGVGGAGGAPGGGGGGGGAAVSASACTGGAGGLGGRGEIRVWSW